MAGEKITSAQVARLAGVSQSAVSRVFTPGASVSPKTAQKVRTAGVSDDVMIDQAEWMGAAAMIEVSQGRTTFSF